MHAQVAGAGVAARWAAPRRPPGFSLRRMLVRGLRTGRRRPSRTRLHSFMAEVATGFPARRWRGVGVLRLFLGDYGARLFHCCGRLFA